MKISRNNKMIGSALLAGVLSFSLNAAAFSEETQQQSEKAQALLDKVKQSEMDRQVAAKQTEIDRLKEDLDKGKKDADTLHQSIDSTNSLINTSAANLDKLSDERKRLEQSLNLALARISAERQRIEALRNLSDAQTKSLSALNRRIEETDVRSRVSDAEMQLLSEGKTVPIAGGEDKGHSELSKLRKTLATCETKTASEENIARNAMKTAAIKVQLADAAAARAERMAEAPEQTDTPEPVGEKTTPNAKPANQNSPQTAKQAKQGQAVNNAPTKGAPTKPFLNNPNQSKQGDAKQFPQKSNQPVSAQ